MQYLKDFFGGILNVIVRVALSIKVGGTKFVKWIFTIPLAIWTFMYWPIKVFKTRYQNAKTWWGKTAVALLLAPVAIIPVSTVVFYGYFIASAIYTSGMNIDYVEKLNFEKLQVAAGEQVAAEGGTDTTKTCGRSAMVDTVAELIDFNVNQNKWMSGSIAYKIGLFGLPWDDTPWFDNKASFQRGVHKAIVRTSIELTDTLGRARGTSEINANLRRAQGNVRIETGNWYYGLNPVGFKQTSWGSYQSARKDLLKYNSDLSRCKAVFDARADNLHQFMDRVAKNLGSTSEVIKNRAENYNGGWFDMRADNVFMEAYGEMYGYYGILQATRHDFRDIVERRALDDVWRRMENQLRKALELKPLIIANGREDGFLIPPHLVVLGFYTLRVRANMVEIREILEK